MLATLIKMRLDICATSVTLGTRYVWNGFRWGLGMLAKLQDFQMLSKILPLHLREMVTGWTSGMTPRYFPLPQKKNVSRRSRDPLFKQNRITSSEIR